MLRVRPVVAVIGLVALTAVPSSAFKLDFHDVITREAFAQVGAELPARVARLLQPRGAGLVTKGFTNEAIDEITAANKATDTDCGPELQRNPDKPASECVYFTETASAVYLLYRSQAPARDHFDDEKIREASDQIYLKLDAIRVFLGQRRFVAARKMLGSALHAIQDFYAHTNWVDLRPTGLEERLGTAAGFVGSPRLAGAEEPTCVGGELLLTALPKATQQALVNNQPAGDPITKEVLQRAFSDPALTSGYFFFWGTPTNLFVKDDPAEFTKWGKCRHGYHVEIPVVAGVGGAVTRATSGDQPGINKDEPARAGFPTARLRAKEHSVKFVKALLADARLNSSPDPEFETVILGLMGYEPMSVLSGFSIVRIPSAPPKQITWDGILEVGLNIWAVHPDIVTCVSSDDGRRICSDECTDFEWQNTLKQCRQRLGPRGFRLPATGRIYVEAWDMDPTTRQLIADGMIDVSDPCVKLTIHEPCEIAHERGPLHINFEAPGTEARPSTPPLAPPSAAGPGGGPPPPSARVAPTPEVIDAAINTRDADNCVGADAFFPQGTSFAASQVGRQLGQDRASRLYQMAAFAMAISDAKVKQTVLNAIQSRVGDDAFFGVMTQVIGDVQQSRALVGAYQGVAQDLAKRVSSTGLDRLLPTAKPQAALVPDVDRWILKRLATGPLVSEALDMMFTGTRTISAECTLNELAKDGFTDTINGR